MKQKKTTFLFYDNFLKSFLNSSLPEINCLKPLMSYLRACGSGLCPCSSSQTDRPPSFYSFSLAWSVFYWIPKSTGLPAAEQNISQQK